MGTVDKLLAEHVSFRVTCVDRVAIAGYIRALQFEGGRGEVHLAARVPDPVAGGVGPQPRPSGRPTSTASSRRRV